MNQILFLPLHWECISNAFLKEQHIWTKQTSFIDKTAVSEVKAIIFSIKIATFDMFSKTNQFATWVYLWEGFKWSFKKGTFLDFSCNLKELGNNLKFFRKPITKCLEIFLPFNISLVPVARYQVLWHSSFFFINAEYLCYFK